MRKKLTNFTLAILMSVGTAVTVAPQPAQAVAGGSLRVCLEDVARTRIIASTPSYAEVVKPGYCSRYFNSVEMTSVRVDTDPDGPSHSYKTMYVGPGTPNNPYHYPGVWEACHTNSDNHAANPSQSSSGQAWDVYYMNYPNGTCKYPW